MITWLLSFVPLWVWLLIAAITLGVTFQFWGPIWLALPRPIKTVLLAIGGGLAIFLGALHLGGKRERERRDKANANAIKNRLEIENEVRDLKPDDVDRRLGRRLRD